MSFGPGARLAYRDALARSVNLATTAENSLRALVNPAGGLGSLAADVVQHDLLGVDELARDVGHGRGDRQRDVRHAVGVAVQQVALRDDQASHAHRQAHVQDVAVGVAQIVEPVKTG